MIYNPLASYPTFPGFAEHLYEIELISIPYSKQTLSIVMSVDKLL